MLELLGMLISISDLVLLGLNVIVWTYGSRK
jgi:hypothetical protein